MKLMGRFTLLGGAVFFAAALCVTTASAQTDVQAWKAPKAASSKRNPIPSNAGSIARGKIVYTQNCLSCHGIKGKGNGPAAVGLKPPVANLTAPDVAKQSDGSLFWKISTGHPPMPMFQYVLTKKQRWDLINYIHTLSK